MLAEELFQLSGCRNTGATPQLRRAPRREHAHDVAVVIRALNHIHYEGPLSVEWEDSGMDCESSAREAFEFVRKLNFSSSSIAFDDSF